MKGQDRDKKRRWGRIGAAAGALLVAFWLSGCALGSYPMSQSAFLLNTYVTVTVYESSSLFPGKASRALEGSMELCRKYEALLSRTEEGSDIDRINRRGQGENCLRVDPDTAWVIEKGLEYGRLSGGAFTIAIEPLTSLWDFTGEEPHVPAEEEIKRRLPLVDDSRMSVHGDMVELGKDGVRLDLGAIAKGFIADRMKEYLVESGVTSAVINLGGNVLCVGEKPDGEPFLIGLRRPFADYSETVGTLRVKDCSVVSSGIYERCFEENGKFYHHILDPKTGYPYDNGLTQVTILSKDSVDGDGLSTACFALGLEKGMELLDSMEGVCGIFMTGEGEIYCSEGAKEYLEEEP